MNIIDCDVHPAWADPNEITKRLPEYFREAGGFGPIINDWRHPCGFQRADSRGPDGAEAGSSLELMRSQLLDGFGISKAILNASAQLQIGVHPHMGYATAYCRAFNDTLAETWLTWDERLYGAIMVAPQDPIAAAAEIRRMAANPRFVQVLFTSATRIPLGQSFYWPIYQAACEVGLPVAVHPGQEGSGISNGFIAGVPSSYLEWHTNLPQNYMGQLVSLVCEGVFEKFPQLRFVCVEGGLAWIPGVLWRLDKNWKALRSSVPWLRRLPSEYLVEHVRFTSQPSEEPPRSEQFLQLLEMIHAERTLLFSSDYPHWDNDDPHHAFPKLPSALAERFFRANAEELYNFAR